MQGCAQWYEYPLYKQILNRLIDGKPLSVIEDVPEIWNDVNCGKNDGIQRFQCSRMSSLFKTIYPDGSVEFSDNNQYVCVDIDNETHYTGGGSSDIIKVLYPITLPYYPGAKIKLYTQECLMDPTMGDFDTKAYLYLIHPTDGRVEINRFFAETTEGWAEITLQEYEERKKSAVIRAN